mmetsp:Transcript_23300/g.40376  ORF Transcript_23300/g.40376 Transcript_23300/m.40376 type:complete len:285 (+) Transcript_23300:493-1347(+)
MGPCQHRLRRGDIPFDHHHMFNAVDLIGEDTHVPIAAVLRGHRLARGFHNFIIVARAIGNQIADRADLHIVLFGKRHQLGQTRHGAVIIHDLTDHRAWMTTRQTGNVHRGFGMACAYQHATTLGAQWEHMPRCSNCRHRVLLVDRRGNGQRAVARRNPGAHPFARLNRHGEGSFVTRRVIHRHHRQTQTVNALGCHRQANQTPTMGGHEVDRIRIGKLRRDDQIAFVFAILMVHKDIHLARFGVGNDLFNWADRVAQALLNGSGLFKGHKVSPLGCGSDSPCGT